MLHASPGPFLDPPKLTVSAGACQIGSGAFGEWFWWLYMVVRPDEYSAAIDLICTRSQSTPSTNFGHPSSRPWSLGDPPPLSPRTLLTRNQVNDKKKCGKEASVETPVSELNLGENDALFILLSCIATTSLKDRHVLLATAIRSYRMRAQAGR
jgi:hypothetical protein